MSDTPRTDATHHKVAQDLDASDLYRYHRMKETARELERELNQAIANRDRAASALATLIALHEWEIETGEAITGEEWEIAGYALKDN
jgi:hypothetical protein